MRIHHLNYGSMRPYFPRITSLVYCLLVETSEGPILVDTGFGTQDYVSPTRFMRAFTALLRCPARWLLGPHTPRLRALHQAHGKKLTLISSHDEASFRKYGAQQ